MSGRSRLRGDCQGSGGPGQVPQPATDPGLAGPGHDPLGRTGGCRRRHLGTHYPGSASGPRFRPCRAPGSKGGAWARPSGREASRSCRRPGSNRGDTLTAVGCAFVLAPGPREWVDGDRGGRRDHNRGHDGGGGIGPAPGWSGGSGGSGRGSHPLKVNHSRRCLGRVFSPVLVVSMPPSRRARSTSWRSTLRDTTAPEPEVPSCR